MDSQILIEQQPAPVSYWRIQTINKSFWVAWHFIQTRLLMPTSFCRPFKLSSRPVDKDFVSVLTLVVCYFAMSREQFSGSSKMSVWNFLKLVVYLCSLYTTSQGLADIQREQLTIGGLYASGAMTTFQNSSGILKIVNEAILFINEQSQLLPGYELAIEWRDTKVSTSRLIAFCNP